MRAVAERNLRGAHALAARLKSIGRLRFAAPYFNEFVLEVRGARRRWERALADGVVAGLPLGDWYPELEECLLVCATELHDTAAHERLAAALAGGG